LISQFLKDQQPAHEKLPRRSFAGGLIFLAIVVLVGRIMVPGPPVPGESNGQEKRRKLPQGALLALKKRSKLKLSNNSAKAGLM
jgi:hypothetical protein